MKEELYSKLIRNFFKEKCPLDKYQLQILARLCVQEEIDKENSQFQLLKYNFSDDELYKYTLLKWFSYFFLLNERILYNNEGTLTSNVMSGRYQGVQLINSGGRLWIVYDQKYQDLHKYSGDEYSDLDLGKFLVSLLEKEFKEMGLNWDNEFRVIINSRKNVQYPLPMFV